MRIIKPQRIGVMHAFIDSVDEVRLVVTGMFGFRLDAAAQFCTDQEMWAAIKSEVGEEDIFDLWMPKKRGEVLIWGKAMSPQLVTSMQVGLQCGPLNRRLGVTGDRTWKMGLLGWRCSAPKPFLEMPLTWTRSFGGPDFALCPVGAGFDAQSRLDRGELVALPNIEPIHGKLLLPSDRVQPVNMGSVDIRWPKSGLRGTFDQSWLATAHPAMPSDFDWDVYNRAQEEQQLKRGYWNGDEPLSLEGMHASHPLLSTALPGVAMRCFYKRFHGDDLSEVPMRLDTVCLLPSALMGVLLFRGEVANAGTDARAIEALMPAAEWMHSAKPFDHYANVYRLRTDDEQRMDHVMSDLQLMPELTAHQQMHRQEQAASEGLQRKNQMEERLQSMRGQATTMLGSAAAAALANPAADQDLLMPFIAKGDLALGDVDLAGMNKAVEQQLQQTERDMSDWEQQAQSLQEQQPAPAIESAVAADAPLDQLDRLADLIESSDSPLTDTLQDWMAKEHMAGIDENLKTDISAWMPSPALEQMLAQSNPQRAEMANSLRDVVRGSRESLAPIQAALDAPDLESAIAKLPASMQAVVRQAIDSAGDVKDLDPLKFLQGGNSVTSDLVKTALQGGGLDAKAMDTLLQAISGLDAGAARIPLSSAPAGLYKAAANPENAQGLMNWLTGTTDVSNPLIEMTEGMLGQANAGVGETSMLQSLRGAVSSHPAVAQWADEQGHSTLVSSADLAAAANEISPMAFEKMFEGDTFSLDALMKLLDSQPEQSEQSEQATEPSAALKSGADSEPPADLSPAAEEYPAAVAKHDPKGQANDQTAQPNEGVNPAFMALAAAPAFARVNADLLGARRKASRVPLQAPRLSLDEAARLGATLRAGHAQGEPFAGRDFGGGDLAGADLRGIDLRGAMLEGANLAGADLSHARCSDAVFVGACMRGAVMFGADFSRANLSGIDAIDSRWDDANLSHARLDGSDFSGATLRQACLDHCDALQTHFEGADLSASRSEEGSFMQANFSHAQLNGVHWHKVAMLEAQLADAVAQQAFFTQCTLVGANAESLDLTQSCLDKAVLLRTQLQNLQAPGLRASGSSWYGSNLTGANFDGACLTQANFMEAQLERSSFAGSQLTEVRLSGACLLGADISNAQLFGAAMRAVDLTGANLCGANLEGADLSGATMDCCDLTGINAMGTLLSKPTRA